MEFYRLSNGDIVLDNYISKAFQITTGIPSYNAPDLYSKFLYGLSMSGRAEKYEPSVAELFSGGHTAYAYALYRDKTGCTLQEARQRVNFMMENIPMTYNGKKVIDTDEFDYSTAMPGDYVTKAVVNDAVDCRSAIYMTDRCSQSGEPYSAKYDDRSGKARETYVTFRKVGGKWPNGIWEYCGHCFRGENKER